MSREYARTLEKAYCLLVNKRRDNEIHEWIQDMIKMESQYERPKCDICTTAQADITENHIAFCAKHYIAYKNLKVKEE